LEPAISVVIPCHNKAKVIEATLTSLARQSLDVSRYEVILVDDGSKDESVAVVRGLDPPYFLDLLTQPNRGAAAARNRGATRARGDILLFLDADVVAGKGLLEGHLACHQDKQRVLATGRIAASTQSTDRSLRDIVPSSSFDLGEHAAKPTFQDAYTGNLSVGRQFFSEVGGFDEDFPASGYDDVEFAYRATLNGGDIVYNPRAVGYHDESGPFRQWCQHIRKYQASAVLLLNKHPELRGKIAHLRDKEPIIWRTDPPGLILRKAARRVLALWPILRSLEALVAALERWWPRPGLLRFFCWKVVGSYQFLGFREGIRAYGW
jgi:GT2 family glycosyltransferase